MQPARKTRDEISRKKTYRPPSVLDMPTPNSDDVEYRWIRVAIRNEDDAKNLSSRRREGWVPVMQDEHSGFDGPSVGDGKYTGAIGIGDLVLMKNSFENNESRRDYYAGKTSTQEEAIDNDIMREQHPSMPLLRERKSTSTRGTRKNKFDD